MEETEGVMNDMADDLIPMGAEFELIGFGNAQRLILARIDGDRWVLVTNHGLPLAPSVIYGDASNPSRAVPREVFDKIAGNGTKVDHATKTICFKE